MDKDTIQQIAAEVVHRLPYGDHPWLFLFVTVVVMALAAGVAAWGGAFLKIKGENFATKRDFDELQRQLSANTELVETIKSEVSQRDWARREWTNLRRIKLEALLEKMHECEVYLDRQRSSAMAAEVSKPERSPIGELDALATLYFSELKSEADKFILICMEQLLLVGELRSAVFDSHKNADPTAQNAAFDNFKNKLRYREFLVAKNTLTAAARSLLKRIMNVDEGPAQSDER